MRKKLTIVLLCLMISVLILPVCGLTGDDIAEGEGWRIDAEGCLHITGSVSNPTGADDDPVSPWSAWKDQILSVETAPGAKIDNGFGLFYYLGNVKSMDLSELDTAGVTSMKSMFAGCSSLSSIRFGNLNTSDVTDMRSMFSRCRMLITADLTGFDTANVTDMSYMFFEAYNLRNLYFGSRFDTSKVRSTERMFYKCRSIKALDLSFFRTPELRNMKNMFSESPDLMYLDLSSFDVSRIFGGDMDTPFYLCKSLSAVRIPEGMLSRVADELIARYPSWMNQADGTLYSSAAELKTVKGTAMLVRAGCRLVSFDLNGVVGRVPPVQVVDAGGFASCPKNDPASGTHEFKGWYADPACTEPFDFSSPVYEDITVYAKWRRIRVIANRIENADILVTPPVEGAYPQLTLPEDGDGYAFTSIQWSYVHSRTGLVSDYRGAFALGTRYMVEISMQAQPGYAFAPQENLDVTINGAKATVSAYPAEAGQISVMYRFPATPVNSPKYTVSFVMGGHGEQEPPQTVAEGGNVSVPEYPYESGWNFDGWYADSGRTEKYNFSTGVTADLTLYAKWTKNDSAVSLDWITEDGARLTLLQDLEAGAKLMLAGYDDAGRMLWCAEKMPEKTAAGTVLPVSFPHAAGCVRVFVLSGTMTPASQPLEIPVY